MESIDPSRLGPSDSVRDMFPIPEDIEPGMYGDINMRGLSPGSPSVPSRSPMTGPRQGLESGGAQSSVAAVAATGLVGQREMERHLQALQAAALAQQVAQRRTEWAQRFADF